VPRPLQVHNYTRVFEVFGVSFRVNGTEAIADACPWCSRDKFYVNPETGQYDCKHCQQQGNITTYLTWLHGEYFRATTPEHYSRLGERRGIAPQTLRRHELAYAENLGCWLVPFKSIGGNVVNLMQYYPNRPKPNKLMLPSLPTAIYGFNNLADADRSKPVLLCEGPFDAIAADYSIGSANRPKYIIVATPGAFKECWAEHFKGRKIRALYDNDKGGRQQRERVQKLLGESRVAAEVKVLKWPEGTPDGYDINDFVRDNPGKSIVGFVHDNCFKVVPEPKLAWDHGWQRLATGPEVIDWVWPNRLRCGSYASYSGRRGTMKSTIMREIVARYTRGEPLPGCTEVGLPAGHVIYITAEDGSATCWTDLERAGANTKLVTVLPATLKDGDPMNVLEHLDELRQMIRRYDVRLVVIDGQNSVVGAPNISTDMLARHNITNKLHQFAQQENICLVGIRNEDAEGRAYGPASMSDLGRCILRSRELKPYKKERYFKLIFERISDAAPSTHRPIPYSVEDLGGPARKILWEEKRPKDDDVEIADGIFEAGSYSGHDDEFVDSPEEEGTHESNGQPRAASSPPSGRGGR
jgi:hypothetical protein